MILYHGSSVEVTLPDIVHSRKNVDFGPGFYTTPIHEQAVKWCGKFKRRQSPAVVSCYQLDETMYQHCKVLKFDSYSEEDMLSESKGYGCLFAF